MDNNVNEEITLKCIIAPQKAKNISLDKEYTGILIDEIGDQVDKYEDATHFLCLNDSGVEQQYKIKLFDAPKLPRITLEQLVSLIDVYWNAEERRSIITFVLDKEKEVDVTIFSALSDMKMNSFSCGVTIGVGLEDTYYNIDFVLSDEILSYFAEGISREDIIEVIFKKFLDNFIEVMDSAIILFSNNFNNHPLNKILDEYSNVSTEAFKNPNMVNTIIKVWAIYKKPELNIEYPYEY